MSTTTERSALAECMMAALFGSTGLTVLTGPFAGMAYVPRAIGSALLPKLLGSYEQELHGEIERLLNASPPGVVNIGCGEGDHAVGIARRLPAVEVIAFDPDPEARLLCFRLAARNSVMERLFLRGECTVPELQATLVPGSLVVCDCEGADDGLRRGRVLAG